MWDLNIACGEAIQKVGCSALTLLSKRERGENIKIPLEGLNERTWCANKEQKKEVSKS
jgi:hypothetical protein